MVLIRYRYLTLQLLRVSLNHRIDEQEEGISNINKQLKEYNGFIETINNKSFPTKWVWVFSFFWFLNPSYDSVAVTFFHFLLSNTDKWKKQIKFHVKDEFRRLVYFLLVFWFNFICGGLLVSRPAQVMIVMWPQTSLITNWLMG